MIVGMIYLALAANAPALRQGLEPLAFLVGNCWEGEFPGSGEKDVHCFEPVYAGQHVRDRHEVTGANGVYRGETLYSWDKAAGAVSYTYWNSLGGVSRGTMRPQATQLDFGDEKYRGPDGKEIAMSTFWRRAGDDSYEAVTVSAGAPSMNRTVRYRRVGGDVTIKASRAGDGSHVLVHETIVPAPPEAVWPAISTASGWSTWAVPAAWGDGETIETSYAATAARSDATTIRQELGARVPGRLLAFRTVKAPDGFPNFETFRRVDHLFELEPTGDGRTKVRLTGSNYPDNDAGRQLLGFFREGNRVSLDRLRRRFTSGPIDWAREPR